MFVDEVLIKVEAGTGGNGCLAFRREKFIAMGGPFGGNGGKGADIIFVVDEGKNTLIDFRYKKVFKGDRGEGGKTKGMHGRGAEDIVLRVPQGTIITDAETGLIIADMTHKDDRVVVATGGRGGRGNIALSTSNNLAPNFSENGEPGEVRNLKVELKLLADVGLVGLPSVGKSTIISKISAAKPKIADYHFTTLSPNLGVVSASKERSFVVADLPGLIEGASLGEGLGDQFLKHIERTRVIAHIIDMGAVEGRDPYEDYIIINNELRSFNEAIMEKPQIIVANKMDMPDFKDNLKEFKKKVDLPIISVSAIDGKGMDKLVDELADMLDKISKIPLYDEAKFESHVLYKFKEEKPFTIHNEDGKWVVRGDRVEKLLKMTNFTTDESFMNFARKLKRIGIDEELRKLGANVGDIVVILDLEFEYED